MPMSLSKTPEPEIRDLGGDPLEGSGFEFEDPATDFRLLTVPDIRAAA